MSKETVLTEKGQTEESQKGHVGRLLVVYFSNNGSEDYVPVIVNKSATDEISKFILQEEAKVKGKIVDLSERARFLSKPKAHGIKRGKSEIGQARISLTTRKNQLQERLNVLCGQALRPIRLIKNEEEKIVDCEIEDFDLTEATWWGYVREEGPLLLDLPREDLALVKEVFVLRQEWRWGVEGAKEKFYNFLSEELGDRMDLDVHLSQITAHFSKA